MSAELFHLTFTRFFGPNATSSSLVYFMDARWWSKKTNIFEFTSAEEADVFCEDKIFFAVFVGWWGFFHTWKVATRLWQLREMHGPSNTW